MKIISSFIFHRIFGWRIEGDFPQNEKKFLIIFAPHTHWVDFLMGLATKWIKGLKANYAAKSSLFKPPFGFIFRWFGGVPIKRVPGGNKVDAIVQLFNSRDKFILAMAPEGTRQKVEHWKTGFYHVAEQAGVRILCVVFNYQTKRLYFDYVFEPTGDMEADMEKIRQYQAEKGHGRYPENAGEVVLRSRDIDRRKKQQAAATESQAQTS